MGITLRAAFRGRFWYNKEAYKYNKRQLLSIKPLSCEGGFLEYNAYMPYKDLQKRNEYNKLYLRKWRKENPERQRSYDDNRERYKVAARGKLNYAIRIGKIIKPKICSNCNVPCNPQAHHPDHTKALEVIWLCPDCHREIEKMVVL